MGRLPRLVILAPSADGYGSDRAMVSLLTTLSEAFEVTLLSAADGPMLEAARSAGAEVVVTADWALRRRYVSLRGIGPAVARVAATLRLLRRLQRDAPFDVVYVNTVASMLLPFLRLATRRPVVVHVREVPKTSGRFNRLLFGAVSRVATLVVCNSQNTERFVIETQTRLGGRTIVIHDGVDPIAAARPSTAAHMDIVCVGRIHPQKGHAPLIDALALGVGAGHDWHLHFWGDALDEHRELEQGLHERVARLGVGDRVHWHGYGSDTAAMYDAMDVAVVPSTWPEGFSLVAAEAQMAGLPVIATPGGPSDIIDDGVTGRIVPHDDAPALFEALVELSDPVRRSQWGSAGRRRALERFTTDSSARRVADAVKSVL